MLFTALLSVDEAAKVLGCSKRSVRRYVADGRLAAYKAGDTPHSPLRIPQESAEALLEARRVRPRRPIPAGPFVDPQGDIFAAPALAAA